VPNVIKWFNSSASEQYYSSAACHSDFSDRMPTIVDMPTITAVAADRAAAVDIDTFDSDSWDLHRIDWCVIESTILAVDK
jgi:hypothetical protein